MTTVVAILAIILFGVMSVVGLIAKFLPVLLIFGTFVWVVVSHNRRLLGRKKTALELMSRLARTDATWAPASVEKRVRMGIRRLYAAWSADDLNKARHFLSEAQCANLQAKIEDHREHFRTVTYEKVEVYAFNIIGAEKGADDAGDRILAHVGLKLVRRDSRKPKPFRDAQVNVYTLVRGPDRKWVIDAYQGDSPKEEIATLDALATKYERPLGTLMGAGSADD